MALLPRAMSQNASLSIVEEKEVGGSLVLLTDREHIHATFQGRNKDEIVFSMGSKLEKILLTCSQMFLAADGSLALKNFYQCC